MTSTLIRDLARSQSDYLQKYNINISRKFSELKYIKRIGIIIGPYLQFENLDWYISELIMEIGYIDNRHEIKKNFAYEQEYKTRALAIHITEAKADETNK